ncbi:MAG: ATP-dependent sacrificial sulfur transferase LarE [Planctomycetes bacterium]|nr:ATP-dependent sacrificial sulfur transferase LarE [Planctomycetota bacterium]
MPPATASLPYEQKLAALLGRLTGLRGAVVAFSGGADSTALLHACRRALGDRTVAVTADSPSLPRAELADAAALARELGARHVVLPTRELERAAYRQNGGDRCYHCKTELFATVARQRARIAPADWDVAYGAITDDLGDHRPGQRAAAEHGVIAPLVDAGFGKPDVRRYSRDAGLRTAEKPSLACLSSRVPYGSPIDGPVLARIECAEAALRGMGFRQFRVRHHGELARLEVAADELERAFAQREAIGQRVRAAGYLFVAFDVFGYRSGSLNELLHRP